jgi:hypothetical protein
VKGLQIGGVGGETQELVAGVYKYSIPEAKQSNWKISYFVILPLSGTQVKVAYCSAFLQVCAA